MVTPYYTYRPGSFATNGPMGDANVIVVHDIECRLTEDKDYAQELTGPNYLGADEAHMGNIKSVHYVVGPFGVCASTPEDTMAWHARGASYGSYGIEQTGFASLTRAEWLSDTGVKQLNFLGDLIADLAQRHNIPLTYLSGDALRAAYADHSNKGAGGITTHQQLTLDGVGGNDHTDPGYPNGGYPMDYVLARARGNNPPHPKDWFEMATEADLETAVRNVLSDPNVLNAIAISVWMKGLRSGPARDDLLKIEDELGQALTKLDQIPTAVWIKGITGNDAGQHANEMLAQILGNTTADLAIDQAPPKV